MLGSDPAPPTGTTADPAGCPSSFRVEVVDEGDETATITVAGELDLVSVGSFRAAVETVLTTPPRRLVFDLRNCPFASVRGFSVIGGCCLTVEEVVVVAASPFVARVMSVLGFDRVSTVVRDHE